MEAKPSKSDDVNRDRAIRLAKSDDVNRDGGSEALRSCILATSVEKSDDSCRFGACEVLRTQVLEGSIFSFLLTSSLFEGSCA